MLKIHAFTPAIQAFEYCQGSQVCVFTVVKIASVKMNGKFVVKLQLTTSSDHVPSCAMFIANTSTVAVPDNQLP